MRSTSTRKLLIVCGLATGATGSVLILVVRTPVAVTIGAVLLIAGWGLLGTLSIRKRRPVSELKQFREELSAHDERQLLRTRRLELAIEAERAKESRHEYLQERTLERIELRLREAALSGGAQALPNGLRRVPDALFVTSNGTGLGHLTRLLAIADRMSEGYNVEFLTLSKAYDLLTHMKYNIRYFPSAQVAGVNDRAWNARFRDYLQHLFANALPKVVVFDGTVVYEGLVDVCRAHATPLIWVQRGCWKPEADDRYPTRRNASRVADLVIVPKDYAVEEEVDVGSGVESQSVDPIVLLKRDQVLSAEQARRELGLSSGQKHILLNLGKNWLSDDPESYLGALRRVANDRHPGATITLVKSPLDASGSLPDDIHVIHRYPVSKYFRAFDLIVSSAGYNSVQEAASLQTPTVFVPNTETLTDDQLRRASSASDSGWAAIARSADELSRVARSLLYGDAGMMTIRETLASIEETSGAASAARIIENQIDKSDWFLRADYISASPAGSSEL